VFSGSVGLLFWFSLALSVKLGVAGVEVRMQALKIVLQMRRSRNWIERTLSSRRKIRAICINVEYARQDGWILCLGFVLCKQR
jgi:hypothetical protein